MWIEYLSVSDVPVEETPSLVYCAHLNLHSENVSGLILVTEKKKKSESDTFSCYFTCWCHFKLNLIIKYNNPRTHADNTLSLKNFVEAAGFL